MEHMRLQSKIIRSSSQCFTNLDIFSLLRVACYEKHPLCMTSQNSMFLGQTSVE